jgi:hypothetical protein
VKHRLSFGSLLEGRLCLLLVFVAFAVGEVACQVDNSGLGLGEMPFLPHDGSSNQDVATGVAGAGGGAGVTGSAGGGAGATGLGGSGGDGSPMGAAGDGAAGAGGSATGGDSGSAGASGAGGQGTAGASGGQGGAGSSGAAGSAGGSGSGGVGGTSGAAGAAGAPPPTCSSKTCPHGCCDGGGRCVTSRSTSQCGNGGAACTACGRCQLCSDVGACDIDPSSTWKVVCVQATIAMTQPNGSNWDPRMGAVGGTAPDPFCEFEMPAGSLMDAKVSPTVTDSFAPAWNYDVTPGSQPIKPPI